MANNNTRKAQASTSRPARRLSPASIYEQMFKTRHRRPGRPEGADVEPMFPSGNAHPLVVRIAERRAFAVVHAEQRQRLSEVFHTELKVLGRRDLAEIAEDAGVQLTSAGDA